MNQPMIDDVYRLANVLHNIALLGSHEGPMNRKISTTHKMGDGLGPLYLQMAERILTNADTIELLVQLIAHASRPKGTTAH